MQASQGAAGEEKEKTPSEVQAEQMLNAIQNGETQVLRMRGGRNNSQARPTRVSDEDW